MRRVEAAEASPPAALSLRRCGLPALQFRDNQVTMGIELHERSSKIFQELLGLKDIVTARLHFSDASLLLANSLFALGDMAISLGQVALFHVHRTLSQTDAPRHKRNRAVRPSPAGGAAMILPVAEITHGR